MSTPSSAARAQPTAPGTQSLRTAFIAQGTLIGSAVALYALVLIGGGLHRQDLAPYLAGGADLLHGHPLYATFLQHPFPDATLRPAFIYPPAFAILLAPLALLPAGAATVVWLAINQAALLAAVFLTLRWLRPSPWACAALIATTATFYPLWIDAAQGQANLLILLLVTTGIAGIVRGDDRAALAFGTAAALKLTPALLLLWLLVDRRWRAAAWMVGGFGVITLIGGLARGGDTLTFFTRVLPALAHGTAVYANQSIAGLVFRLGTTNAYTTPWIVLPMPALLIGALSLMLAGWWFWITRKQAPATRAVSFLPLMPLLSAVTWPHHLVILLPLIWATCIALDTQGWPWRRTLAASALLLTVDVISRWPAGPGFGQPGFRAAQTQDPLVLLTGNALLLGTLALFFTAPWLLRSR